MERHVIYSFMPTCTDDIMNKNIMLTKEDSSVVTAAKLVKLLGKLLKQGTKRLVCNTSGLEVVQRTCRFSCCVYKIKHIKDRKLLLLFPQFIKSKTSELLWNPDITKTLLRIRLVFL